MMDGPPGAGKSTLAEGIVAALGTKAMLFEEELIFELGEFADVGTAFRTKTFPDTEMMLDAYRLFFERVRTTAQIVVFGWSCVGMIEDLPCAQRDRQSVTSLDPHARADLQVLTQHARDVRELVGEGVLFVPDVPISMSTLRALEQRGEAWFAAYDGIDTFGGASSLLEGAINYFETAAARHLDVVRAHEAGGWNVVRVDATASAPEVLGEALRTLEMSVL
jgi:hypothetical protein